MKKNRKIIFFHRMVCVACMLALFLYFISTEVCAAENSTPASQAAVVSSRTTEEDIYIYIKGVGDIASGTTVQVGNTLCEDIQVADVVSMGMPIKTTILFDNSLSLSKRWGSQAKELIAGLIDNHAEGEEFKIATFADGLNVVADFSTEYESLKADVEEIEFLNQNSYLTDILYELLRQSGSSGEANYERFIIITDGADDNDIKYTQAELADLMKSSGVVIHTVGVKASNNNSLLENLFSYARYTGGTYSLAESATDVESIRNSIDEDYSLLCLRLVPNTAVMDGGRKEAKLNLNTSGGAVVLTASLQMPFGEVQSAPAGSVEQSAAPTPTPEPVRSELPSIEVSSQSGEETSETDKSGVIPFVVAGVIVLAGIIVLAVLLVLKGKKKKQVDVVIADNGQSGGSARNNGAQASSAQQGGSARSGGNTARLGGQANAGTAGKTLRLQGGTGQQAQRQSFVTLTDINNPQRIFRVPIDTRIVVGRESGEILLGYDAAVSYTHCEIIKKGNLFYVNDLKSSNGTFYGNMRVNNETPIMNGGILEIGSGKYKITIEN